MKVALSEIKKNVQGTNNGGEEAKNQINSLEHKVRKSIHSEEQEEKINIQPEQNEETAIQKNEERLRDLWDNFKCSNIQIIGVPEGEE